MRVFQINTACGKSGPGKVVANISKILTENACENLIAYGRGSTDVFNAYKIGNNIDVYYHALMSRLTDKHGCFSVTATRKLVEKIKEFSPDIVQLHCLHGYYLNYVILFEYLACSNIPVVWTMHDCWAFTGHCAYFDYVGCKRWEIECRNCKQLNTYPKSLLFDNSTFNYYNKKKYFNLMDKMTIVTPSHWLAELVKKSFLDKYNINVIGVGVDLMIFKPTHSKFRNTYNINNKKIILGVSSGWEQRKGLKDFIALNKQIDHSRYVIVLVGVTSQQRVSLSQEIIAIERTNNQKELAEIYSAADVFFNPTYEDNFPATNIEALACGTPVITYDTGGSVEAIDDKCGVIVEKGNIDGVLNAVDMLCERQDSVKECLVRAKSFDDTVQYKNYLALYKELLG